MTENTPSDALVEAMARAIYEADDPWHVAWPWPDLQSDQAGVDHYRRCAEAAAAVVQAGLDDRVSTTSPVDDSETGNTSGKPDIEAAVKSDTAPVSDKLVEAMALWERADRAGEDAYVEAVQIGVASADDAHKCGAIAAAAVIADALAERDAEIARLRDDNEGLRFVLQVVENPDRQMCCDGRECGCMGSTVGQYAAWAFKDEAERDAEQAKQIEALRAKLAPFAFLEMEKDEGLADAQYVWETIHAERVQDWFAFDEIQAARAALGAKP